MNMFCHNCGKQIPDDTRFCRYCGAAQGGVQRAPAPAAPPQPQPAPQPVRSNLPVDEAAFRKYVSPRVFPAFIVICVITIFCWLSMSSEALVIFAALMVVLGIPYLIGKSRVSNFIAKMRANGTYEPVLREFAAASSMLDDKVRCSENYIFQKGSTKFYAWQDICWIYRFNRKYLFITYKSLVMVGDRTGTVGPFCSLKIGNQAGTEEMKALAARIRTKNPALLLGYTPAAQQEYHSRYPLRQR